MHRMLDSGLMRGRGLDRDGTIAREGALSRVTDIFAPVVEAARSQIIERFNGTRLHSAYPPRRYGHVAQRTRTLRSRLLRRLPVYPAARGRPRRAASPVPPDQPARPRDQRRPRAAAAGVAGPAISPSPSRRSAITTPTTPGRCAWPRPRAAHHRRIPPCSTRSSTAWVRGLRPNTPPYTG